MIVGEANFQQIVTNLGGLDPVMSRTLAANLEKMTWKELLATLYIVQYTQSNEYVPLCSV